MGKKTISTQNSKSVDELSEDMEVVGPGLMLSDARKKLSLSTENVADRLKFKTNLVENIEQDIFDQKLPATFNRGYLRSYAKLVNIDADEVLSAYDLLGVAEVQRSEMQSFSNLTEKQAEHSLLMWISYFIVAVLLGLMVLWWLQEPNQLINESIPQKPQVINKNIVNQSKSEDEKKVIVLPNQENVQPENKNNELNSTQVESDTQKLSIPLVTEQEVPHLDIIESNKPSVEEADQEPVITLSTVVFTFSGDCWVNIYDATGERIAWGVKKSGYVMTVTGKAPLKITLGKPELASIVFNDQLIDMSQFNAGNVAKFTLPLSL